MSAKSYQIRVCQNCGLRYPLVERQSFGERCPQCLGETRVVAEYPLDHEPTAENSRLSSDIHLAVLLDNIRSAWNVGSIFRSADGFEFQHAYLCGITPTPEDPNVRKTALGAAETVTWSVHKNAVALARELREQGNQIWVLEQTENSQSIDSPTKTTAPNIVLVVGNEVTGVDPGLLEIADRVVHLPMRGQKQSFNVAVAFAVAAQIIRSRF